MAVDEKVDQLARQLNVYGPGPVDALANEAVARFRATSAQCVAWLRQATHDRPVIALLAAYQFGYIIAKIGRRRARR